VAQEALANAVRHGDAGTVELSLAPDGEGVRLVVRDDGAGFSLADGLRSAGLGLAMMRERAAEVGGSVEIVTAPGAGTTVRLWVP
jgi:NarL family two-component system sensor histidine kinase LiaS